MRARYHTRALSNGRAIGARRMQTVDLPASLARHTAEGQPAGMLN